MAGLTSHLWLSNSPNLAGERVTGKASLLMTNEEGELDQSVIERERCFLRGNTDINQL